jgi:hypothetical protein
MSCYMLKAEASQRDDLAVHSKWWSLKCIPNDDLWNVYQTMIFEMYTKWWSLKCIPNDDLWNVYQMVISEKCIPNGDLWKMYTKRWSLKCIPNGWLCTIYQMVDFAVYKSQMYESHLCVQGSVQCCTFSCTSHSDSYTGTKKAFSYCALRAKLELCKHYVMCRCKLYFAFLRAVVWFSSRHKRPDGN